METIVRTQQERIDVLGDFQRLLGLEDDHFLLYMIFILSCFRCSAPYPILILQGEQGSRKSTISKMIRLLIDPNLALVNTLPKNEQDLMIAMKSNRILVYDNLSGLKDTVSDWLCRAATGTGLTVRQLYTTDGQVTFTGACPIVLNGIDDIAKRSDLLSRSLVLNLNPIVSGARLPSDEVNRRFNELRPRLLGVIFDLVSEILRKLPETHVETDLRMIDAVRWATAAEEMLGVEPGRVLEVCQQNYLEATQAGLKDDPVGSVLIEHMSSRQEWVGTMQRLHDCLSGRDGRPTGRDWPNQPNALSRHLNRLATNMRDYGIDIERSREGGTGNRVVVITNRNFHPVTEALAS